MIRGITMRERPRTRSWDEGATAVEAALSLSLLVLLIIGIIEFAQVLWTWNTMALAVQQAARYAMVHNNTQNPDGTFPSCPSTGAQAAASDVLSSYPASNSVNIPTPTCDTTTNPPTMTIQGNFSFDFIPSGLLPFGPITVASQTTIPLQ
jgi:Flp pilus assembly protein TadG